RSSGSSRGGEGRDEVLQKAKRERAERQKARASRGQAVSIQSWFRGHSAAAAARRLERADWDRKMSDFGKLQRTLVAQGIPFTPPVKFVLMALQQFLFFYRREQDSARLCLFCESVLILCILQADPKQNPAAHMAGVAESCEGKEAPAVNLALRLRLRKLLAVCLDHTERELNKGVNDGNTPLKVLLMLTGSSRHAACPSGMPEPGMTPHAVAARAEVSRSCLEILVVDLGLFSAIRNVLIGGASERKAIESAGTTAQLKPSAGRQGAILDCWELGLTALDAAGSLSPAFTTASLSRPPPKRESSAEAAAIAAAAAQLRARFVAEILSVPLLPARLGIDGVNLLLRVRLGAFVDCLRDFRVEMATRPPGGAAGSGAGWGQGGSLKRNARRNGSTGGMHSGSGFGGSGGGEWGAAFRLPPPPVSCCTTEAFLLGNVVAMGTKIPIEGGGEGGAGEGGGLTAMTRKRTGRCGQREFMRAATSLLQLPAIPESLLTDRQAFTWQNQAGASGGGGGGGTSMTALAVPQAVQDQVRLLVSDRWIRSASKLALEGVNERLLERCTEVERLENKETLESNAANLAMASVQSHRAEANRGFVSKWAEKLLKTSKKWFSANDQQPTPAATRASALAHTAPPLPPAGAGSGLIDASAASRAAAMGGKEPKNSPDGSGRGAVGGGGAGGGVVDPADTAHAYDADNVLALSELLGVLLRRWGTGANASNQVMQVRRP
ncbi:unnamed protein product, partial [Hapterophycus canaliculatus]